MRTLLLIASLAVTGCSSAAADGDRPSAPSITADVFDVGGYVDPTEAARLMLCEGMSPGDARRTIEDSVRYYSDEPDPVTAAAAAVTDAENAGC